MLKKMLIINVVQVPRNNRIYQPID